MNASEHDFSSYKALVIDDQVFIRRIIVGLLRQAGFSRIDEAEDGASGLKANNEGRPDVILCDIEMEPIDGLTFLQVLRTNKDIANNDVPVIFLTGHTETEIVHRARELGVDSFLVKPPTLSTLVERIASALSKRRNGATD